MFNLVVLTSYSLARNGDIVSALSFMEEMNRKSQSEGNILQFDWIINTDGKGSKDKAQFEADIKSRGLEERVKVLVCNFEEATKAARAEQLEAWRHEQELQKLNVRINYLQLGNETLQANFGERKAEEVSIMEYLQVVNGCYEEHKSIIDAECRRIDDEFMDLEINAKKKRGWGLPCLLSHRIEDDTLGLPTDFKAKAEQKNHPKARPERVDSPSPTATDAQASPVPAKQYNKSLEIFARADAIVIVATLHHMGMEDCEFLKQTYPHLPIIILTEYDFDLSKGPGEKYRHLRKVLEICPYSSNSLTTGLAPENCGVYLPSYMLAKPSSLSELVAADGAGDEERFVSALLREKQYDEQADSALVYSYLFVDNFAKNESTSSVISVANLGSNILQLALGLKKRQLDLVMPVKNPRELLAALEANFTDEQIRQRLIAEQVQIRIFTRSQGPLVSYGFVADSDEPAEAKIVVNIILPTQLNQMFIQSLLANATVCILTGDQSLVEGLIKGKPVFYQAMSWKQGVAQALIAAARSAGYSKLAEFYSLQVAVQLAVMGDAADSDLSSEPQSPTGRAKKTTAVIDDKILAAKIRLGQELVAYYIENRAEIDFEAQQFVGYIERKNIVSALARLWAQLSKDLLEKQNSPAKNTALATCTWQMEKIAAAEDVKSFSDDFRRMKHAQNNAMIKIRIDSLRLKKVVAENETKFQQLFELAEKKINDSVAFSADIEPSLMQDDSEWEEMSEAIKSNRKYPLRKEMLGRLLVGGEISIEDIEFAFWRCFSLIKAYEVEAKSNHEWEEKNPSYLLSLGQFLLDQYQHIIYGLICNYQLSIHYEHCKFHSAYFGKGAPFCKTAIRTVHDGEKEIVNFDVTWSPEKKAEFIAARGGVAVSDHTARRLSFSNC